MKDIVSLAKEGADLLSVRDVMIASIGEGANFLRFLRDVEAPVYRRQQYEQHACTRENG